MKPLENLEHWQIVRLQMLGSLYEQALGVYADMVVSLGHDLTETQREALSAAAGFAVDCWENLEDEWDIAHRFVRSEEKDV